ncbi:ATP synthase mitochondrial F1 complex assembly factor 1-like [Zophobas morio]|uniref:ATP synthase mitochondrial F1 complex assembly factor 1-like n=1 Tax=Zophobas morio TaxID=2755281 RepID=UPI0030828CE2
MGWYLSFSLGLLKNPFFQKYKEKIAFKNKSQDELLDCINTRKRVKTEEDNLPLAYLHKLTSTSESFIKKAYPVKALKDFANVDKLRDRTAEEISALWLQYFKFQNKVFAVLSSAVYDTLAEHAKACPLFIYPVPRQHGYELFFTQYSQNHFYATSLLDYKKNQEFASVVLTISYFLDFSKDKGIALMLGDPDTSRISTFEAQSLANQITTYYLNLEKYNNFVKVFNTDPSNFDYLQLFKNLTHP